MRTIITTTDVYTLAELKEANSDGYEWAINRLAEAEQKAFFECYFSDYENTLEAIESLFSVKRSDWEINGYSFFYCVKDMAGDEVEGFKRTYAYVVNNIMPQIEDINDCSLTGFCADYDALQVLQDFLKGKQIFNNMPALVNAMCEAVLQEANNEFQSIAEDIDRLEDLADANGYEFTIDGTEF